MATKDDLGFACSSTSTISHFPLNGLCREPVCKPHDCFILSLSIGIESIQLMHEAHQISFGLVRWKYDAFCNNIVDGLGENVLKSSREVYESRIGPFES